jgi:transposase InsO family protein
VTCKDHFTGFTGFFAIPKKEATFVVHRLEQFFAIIGYPKLFHTDNGKEFTAKSILEFLKNQNPTIASVTGRPRTPSNQGCVENMNKFGKKILQSLEDDERMAGGKPNWVSLLPRVTVAMLTPFKTRTQNHLLHMRLSLASNITTIYQGP